MMRNMSSEQAPTSDEVMAAIRDLRRGMGHNQGDFARLIGKSYPMLQRYERVRPPMDFEILMRLSGLAKEEALDDMSELFVWWFVQNTFKKRKQDVQVAPAMFHIAPFDAPEPIEGPVLTEEDVLPTADLQEKLLLEKLLYLLRDSTAPKPAIELIRRLITEGDAVRRKPSREKERRFSERVRRIANYIRASPLRIEDEEKFLADALAVYRAAGRGDKSCKSVVSDMGATATPLRKSAGTVAPAKSRSAGRKKTGRAQ